MRNRSRAQNRVDMTDHVNFFFAAQDANDGGNCELADELFATAAEAAALAAAAGAADDGNGDGIGPPAGIVQSMALNGQAELALDRALASGFPLQLDGTNAIKELRHATTLLQMSINACTENATALMNLAMLARDEGDASLALRYWSEVCARTDDGGCDDDDWREDWLCEPRRRSTPLACLYRALLLSQLGRHDEASTDLRRLGYRWRLSPAVWDCARTQPLALDLQARSAASAASGASEDHARLYSHAVGEGVYSALRRTFAPGAAYWRETRYETASASKRYFTFYVDLEDLKASQHSQRAAPTSAIEALLLALLPLTGKASSLRSCEWWVHQRAAGRGFGHELHYDLEEQTMETCGRVLHPAVSSVVYLSDGGDPTVVLDETLDAPLSATRAYIAHPRSRSFFTFRGDLLHGVLPGPFAHKQAPAEGEQHEREQHAPPAEEAAARKPTKRTRRSGVTSVTSAASAANAATERFAAEGSAVAAPSQRLTLLVAWYGERTAGRARRSRLGAQSAAPRPSRSMTWPRELEMTAAEQALEAERVGSEGGEHREVTRVAIPQASPVWMRVQRVGEPEQPVDVAAVVAEARAAASSSTTEEKEEEEAEEEVLPAPCLQQHFFLHSAREVGDRLRAEHGIGGSWAGAAGQGGKG